MSEHNTEAVTGLLDGELKGIRLWLVRRHVANCPACAAEYRHQQHVRRMLRENVTAPAMTDSPEFFWSKVKTGIQREEGKRIEIPAPGLTLADWLRQHQYALASATAAIVAVIGVLWFAAGSRGPVNTVAIPPTPTPTDYAKVEQLKAPIPHTAATSFDSDDATVIWVTGLPWTPDMNEMKTQFAHLDT